MIAVLALEDGTWYKGVSAGAPGETTGEVVFNTSMTGYQEVLTDDDGAADWQLRGGERRPGIASAAGGRVYHA